MKLAGPYQLILSRSPLHLFTRSRGRGLVGGWVRGLCGGAVRVWVGKKKNETGVVAYLTTHSSSCRLQIAPRGQCLHCRPILLLQGQLFCEPPHPTSAPSLLSSSGDRKGVNIQHCADGTVPNDWRNRRNRRVAQLHGSVVGL